MESTDDARVGDRRRLLVGAAAVSVLALMTVTAIWLTRDDPIVSTVDAAPNPTIAERDGATTVPPTSAGAPKAAATANSTTVAPTRSTTTTRSSTSTSTTTTVDPERLPTLSEGSTGIDVRMLQRMLNIVTGADLATDGVYGEATVEAVDAFQRFVGLEATGEADHETRMLLRYIDGGRSLLLPTWPLPTIGDGGANGCQVAMIGDSLMAGTQQLHADRLADIGCASAVDGVGGRSTAFGWQCRVLQANGRLPLLLLAEPEPGNDTCAPSGLELLRMWSEARALGDIVVLALGTNDATLFNDRHWGGHWEQVLEFAGNRPVIVVTTRARPGSSKAPAQAAYSEALRQWCASAPRCVLADWALTEAANDAGSYIDSVHLTLAGTDARATFISNVVRALLTGQPIPNPVALPTPTTTVVPTTSTSTTTTSTSTTTTSAATSTSTSTAAATTSTTVPISTTTSSTTSTTSTSTATTTSTTEPPAGG